MSVVYKETGKQVQVPVHEMVDHVKQKLLEFDQLKIGTQVTPQFSPYKDPINYTTSEGKLIQIPKYIQEQACAQYLQEKNSGNNLNQYNMEYSGPSDPQGYQNISDGNNPSGGVSSGTGYADQMGNPINQEHPGQKIGQFNNYNQPMACSNESCPPNSTCKPGQACYIKRENSYPGLNDPGYPGNPENPNESILYNNNEKINNNSGMDIPIEAINDYDNYGDNDSYDSYNDHQDYQNDQN